jgi:hypothetical protein
LSSAADQGCDLGVRVEDNVADADAWASSAADQQGLSVVGEFFWLRLGGGLAVCPAAWVR